MLLALLLAAPARAQEAPFPRSVVLPALQQAFTAIIERHLESAAPADMALWSLRGLGAVDTRLGTEVSNGRMRLSIDDRLLLEQPVPLSVPVPPPPGRPGPRQSSAEEPAAEALAGLLTRFYGAAWAASPLLQRAGTERMLQAGFDELFNHLDPYSRYVTADEALQARERRVGQSSLGLRLAAGRRGTVVIASLVPNGPAAEAGLREGDQLVSIDGYPVSARYITDAAELLEGLAGTEVTLVLRRGNQRHTVTLLRSAAPARALRVERQEGILWLRLTAFSSHTTETLSAVLNEAFAEPQPPRGVVLDLRGNRGGVLSQAMSVADAFLTGGPIASSLGRHPDSVRAWTAAGTDLSHSRPLVILVDGRTASSAEIVAAALSDRGRAAVVGSSTLGKGLIQIVIPLSNGAEVLISWSRVLAPQGWPVQGLGVQPTICTSLGLESVRMEMAQLSNGHAPRAAVLARLRAARPPVPASEVAALRATCPPAEERELDSEVAKALIDHPRLLATALSP
ncbi:S41 family peptidase [Pseudoroseomonas ludipueritiae]|uniref:PDZ domain-containing protein n=1 Tax=Pseudoroseomonas ludipueritiae TaxID=198093 RepID=A0ABR7R438_9PROT|nr:PDZ domain-containing protein [Pseudoroseomonas ludipueritiae]